MNVTSTGGGFLGSENIGGFGYGIGVSVGILLLITTITLASYYCTRNSQQILYSEAKLKNKDSTATCCSICLADYKNSDTLRVLPDCSHLFHLKCVDPWLRLHPTCPVCRTSPLPTPLSTPLAEVVPLATRPLG
ncbi:OLC1v1034032C1 [Oldenlandia corymbosa var. corymbosa]|uniref:OLC1v1034032C1 n=1 Tax=Oldenlandia corymbosa var. corymbosa TaxID=529605 RepID=A0AAV1CPS1_OLDCO|nr:OLC1v1034032C1 [Oldenlandia corymbosa var. corymbosa]